MIEKTLKMVLLYDFYGNLLTEKQSNAFFYYYMRDLSLAEIGEKLHISRQGAFDLIKRAEKSLVNSEEMLGLVKKFDDDKKDIKKIINKSQEIKNKIRDNNKLSIEEDLDEIIKLGISIIER